MPNSKVRHKAGGRWIAVTNFLQSLYSPCMAYDFMLERNERITLQISPKPLKLSTDRIEKFYEGWRVSAHL